MQETMFVIPIPPLLAIGFLLGIMLLVIGYLEKENSTIRNHWMGTGIAIIGIMIPVTPLSWYLYWMLLYHVALGSLDIGIILVSVIIGIVLIYKGVKTYLMT